MIYKNPLQKNVGFNLNPRAIHAVPNPDINLRNLYNNNEFVQNLNRSTQNNNTSLNTDENKLKFDSDQPLNLMNDGKLPN